MGLDLPGKSDNILIEFRRGWQSTANVFGMQDLSLGEGIFCRGADCVSAAVQKIPRADGTLSERSSRQRIRCLGRESERAQRRTKQGLNGYVVAAGGFPAAIT
ncbi:hypothetical protein [Paenibacillus sp. GP183]|uniref:hypothetical protein n=1 Tax=Paenibacillus sp. GP183 TaxID=1882751 RepID=UPI000894FBC2|nr:hypothetical protein [Paenibacillus sp. GP183]SED18036.1 hypothetical protein SAMN05443246_5974 [Paenibacillus sp. GP183]